MTTLQEKACSYIRRLSAFLVGVMLLCPALGSADPEKRSLGDSRVFAAVPFPGFPEGIAVNDDLVYVSGPASFGEPANEVPSRIFGYDLDTGDLVQEIEIQGQSIIPKAVSSIALDDEDGLYVLDEQQGVLRIDVDTEEQTTYGAPFFPFFSSPFNHPAPYLINDLAFDKEGYLYVTDSFQATIWRVPPGGGAPEIWFHHPSIDGVFGPNGVRIDKKSRILYFTVTIDGMGRGVVYRLPLVDVPTINDLEVFHTYTPAAPDFLPPAPDGIAFGRSGKLYVALALTHQISVLDKIGQEEVRYSGPAQTDDPGNPLPWANPANIAFNNKGKALLVTNHANSTGLPDPSHLFAIFDVFVSDKAGRLFKDPGGP